MAKTGKKYKWKCPKCGAPAEGCGKGSCLGRGGSCSGLLCECSEDTSKLHGEILEDVCPNARCYHCDWAGQMPFVTEMKTWPSWAKTALKNGWSPPKGWSPS